MPHNTLKERREYRAANKDRINERTRAKRARDRAEAPKARRTHAGTQRKDPHGDKETAVYGLLNSWR